MATPVAGADEALAAYQHALRRCLEPLTRRCNGPASAATVQRFIDRATGAAIVYASRVADLTESEPRPSA